MDYYTHRVAGHIYEGLLNYHPLKRPMTLVPALAEALPTISKDGMTYTFKIKKGVKFQDDPCFKATGGKGRELVAQDFVYSWKRIADPKVQSDTYWIFEGKIKGLDDWRRQKGEDKVNYETPVEGLQTPDSHTLVIKLVKPYYQLNSVLAMATAYAVPREAVDHYGPEFLNHPVGTGPFRLAEWVKNSRITLEKNPTFRGETYPAEGTDRAEHLVDAGKPIPFVDKIIFTEFVEDQPMWLGFLKGDLDYSGIPKDNFDAAVDRATRQPKKELTDKGIKVEFREDADITYTVLNMADPFLGKHKLVRQAMNLATDHATLIDKFYNGRAVPAQGPIPPGFEGYDPNFKNPYQGHDLARAKALLEKAGFPGGKGIPELVYEITNSTTGRQMGEFFQQEMAAIGIKVRLNVNTWPEMTEKLKTRKAQLAGLGWNADYSDPENFLQLFYGKNVAPGANNANYSSPAFDKLYEKALSLPPGSERTKLYLQMRDLVVEDAPWIFHVHRVRTSAHHPWVKNFLPSPMVNGWLRYVRLERK